MDPFLDLRDLANPNVDRTRVLIYVLAALGIGLAILAVISLITAIWLRLAAAFVGVREADFLRCYRASFLGNFVTTMFFVGAAWALGAGLLISGARDERVVHNWALTWFSGASLTWFFGAIVLVHAAIFSSIFRSEPQELPLSLGASAGLAAVYLAISAFMGVIINAVLWTFLPKITLPL